MEQRWGTVAEPPLHGRSRILHVAGNRGRGIQLFFFSVRPFVLFPPFFSLVLDRRLACFDSFSRSRLSPLSFRPSVIFLCADSPLSRFPANYFIRACFGVRIGRFSSRAVFLTCGLRPGRRAILSNVSTVPARCLCASL